MTQHNFSGFSSATFCADLAEPIAAEALRQYGYTDHAVYVFRVKAAQLNGFFNGKSELKKWDAAKRKQAEQLQRIVFLSQSTQGRLQI